MQPFRRLIVWQKAHQLSVACHKASFRRGVGAPGFRAQLLRAVDSIASNIAEGAGQRSQRQFARFLDMAMSSAHEVDNHLELAAALEIFDHDEIRQFQERIWEIKRMLTGLQRAVRRKAKKEPQVADASDARGAPEAPNNPV